MASKRRTKHKIDKICRSVGSDKSDNRHPCYPLSHYFAVLANVRLAMGHKLSTLPFVSASPHREAGLSSETLVPGEFHHETTTQRCRFAPTGTRSVDAPRDSTCVGFVRHSIERIVSL